MEKKMKITAFNYPINGILINLLGMLNNAWYYAEYNYKSMD